MGVCKCKQRNVTNQFCYVCRTNVCESCMVKDHQRCIIKSYVHWLQDSDYSATCSLCLESIDRGEVIRLTCYDLFHWDCFNAWALKFPESSKKTDYTCPDCKAQVFPPQALVSPIADVLRQKFATVGWGRKGLGMPLQTNEKMSTTLPTTPVGGDFNQISSTPKTSYKPLPTVTPFVPLPKQQQQQNQQQATPTLQQQQLVETKVQASATFNRESKYEGTTSRKQPVVNTRHQDSKINLSYDHDENKYKRKGFLHWFGNMMKLWKKTSEVKKESNLTFKRVFIALVLFTLIFMTIIYFMSVIGGRVAEDDPMLNPDLNRLAKVERRRVDDVII